MARWCDCENPKTRGIAYNRCLLCGKIIRVERVMTSKAYLKYLQLMNQKKLLLQKIANLKVDAIKEMHADGYTYDQIAGLLLTAKITIMDVLKGKKTTLRGRDSP